MPLASSYAESSFSFTGGLVTKKRVNLTATHVEQISVTKDYISQPGYTFDASMESYRAIQKRHAEDREREKEKRRKKKLKALKAAQLEFLKDNSDGEGVDAAQAGSEDDALV
jgi:hypothetical protein